MDSAFKRARRDYHALATNTVRFALWITFWGVVSAALSLYFTWDHSRWAQLAIGIGALVGGAVLAFLLPFFWLLVVAPHRIVRDELVSLSHRMFALETAPGVQTGEDVLRVALMAVRSELGACGQRITEALSRKRWWMPDTDPLPADQWREHFAALSNPSLPTELHAQIDLAYNHCDRLNHRIKRYVAEQKNANPLAAALSPGDYSFRTDDERVLRSILREIMDTNAAISERVDGAVQG